MNGQSLNFIELKVKTKVTHKIQNSIQRFNRIIKYIFIRNIGNINKDDTLLC